MVWVGVCWWLRLAPTFYSTIVVMFHELRHPVHTMIQSLQETMGMQKDDVITLSPCHIVRRRASCEPWPRTTGRARLDFRQAATALCLLCTLTRSGGVTEAEICKPRPRLRGRRSVTFSPWSCHPCLLIGIVGPSFLFVNHPANGSSYKPISPYMPGNNFCVVDLEPCRRQTCLFL